MITELAKVDERIFVIDCDIAKSCKTIQFAKAFPDRHLNVGIAEQNAAGIAAGLATMGKIPFISTYAVFGSMRMCEQVRTSICYPGLNVKVACSHGGLTPGSDGATHQAIEDMGIYRSIPGMVILMPADYQAARKLVVEARDYNGPVYLRFTREAVLGYYGENESFEIGKGKTLREGRDISLIFIGDMLRPTLEAAEVLEKRGISVELIDMHTLKPLDTELVAQTAAKTGRVITIEDHNYINGLGSAVAEVLAERGQGMLRRVGIKDCYGESGEYAALLQKYEMDSAAVVKLAETLFVQ